VLPAARRAGLSEIWRIGGAQAVAALAVGDGQHRRGGPRGGPGNAFVAEAKRQVFGWVGIDSIAGPSEVVILADAANDPRHVAMDLLAQAEHDEAAQSILLTDDAALADAVARAVEQAAGHPAPRRHRRRELAAPRRHHPRAGLGGGRGAHPTGWRPSICR
jgi:histidinol dehydrogenase